jgi:hypothetical protein
MIELLAAFPSLEWLEIDLPSGFDMENPLNWAPGENLLDRIHEWDPRVVGRKLELLSFISGLSLPHLDDYLGGLSGNGSVRDALDTWWPAMRAFGILFWKVQSWSRKKTMERNGLARTRVQRDLVSERSLCNMEKPHTLKF